MIPIIQTKIHIPGEQNGNCMSAALASILEIPLKDVPKFEDMSAGRWYFELLKWLESLGFQLLRWDEEYYVDGYFLAGGVSPRGLAHLVVYKGTEMIHDPHPSGGGIKSVTSAWVLLPLDPSKWKREGLRYDT